LEEQAIFDFLHNQKRVDRRSKIMKEVASNQIVLISFRRPWNYYFRRLDSPENERYKSGNCTKTPGPNNPSFVGPKTEVNFVVGNHIRVIS
jgi:hypothetical protein